MLKLNGSGLKSNIVAPRIAGTANKKEKVVACSLLIPKSKLVDIVEPERETPGMMARP